MVFGDLLARRAAYRSRTFFTLCNYEQIRADGDEILDLLQPDIVILDEAQRIKNWQTKTANAVKRLHSRYAFVLTGTPLENRIDEIYSIVEFLDPELLGPLFRFNREYYELDAKGHPVGYRNLEQLADRIAPVMLRRRKEEVESQLPSRMTKTFFVPMTDTQQAVYDDYEFGVKRLAAIASRRPLTKEEFERLQKFLACMRMVCDTPTILDGQRHECPKLDEIERLLPRVVERSAAQDPDLLGVGSDAGAGARVRGCRQRRFRVAHRLRPADPAPRRDPSLSRRSRVPPVSFPRNRAVSASICKRPTR